MICLQVAEANTKDELRTAQSCKAADSLGHANAGFRRTAADFIDRVRSGAMRGSIKRSHLANLRRQNLRVLDQVPEPVRDFAGSGQPA
jgi:hypothetical protein